MSGRHHPPGCGELEGGAVLEERMSLAWLCGGFFFPLPRTGRRARGWGGGGNLSGAWWWREVGWAGFGQPLVSM